MTCAACRAEVPAEARFCPACAAPVAPPTDSSDPLRAALEASLGFQYRFLRLLGRGGMGAVYLAHELALDREVAIKVLPPERGVTAEARDRFRREARTAARLSHPGIVPLHTFGEVGGLVYIVMGYVRGESLASRLRRRGRLEPPEARRILGEVADALAYAHALGVVHRDVKPDNILLDADSGRALLTDFGVAKATATGQTLTTTGQIVGTPHYMSPEQASGRSDLDGRSDLYSLAVMGYAMLGGRLPFEGRTVGELLTQHLTQPPPPLAETAPGLPAPLVSGIMRALAKDPAQRFADAKSFKVAIDPDEQVDPPKFRSMRVYAHVLLGALVGWAYWLLYLACDPRVEPSTHPARALLTAATVASVLGALVTTYEIRRQYRIPLRDVIRATVLQPPWWPGWYPQALRRSGDLWPRLPPRVKRVRHLASFMIVLGLTVVAPLVVGMGAALSYHEKTGLQTRAGAWVLLGQGRGLQRRLAPLAGQATGLLFLVFQVDLVTGIFWLKRRLGPAYDTDEMPMLAATWGRDSAWRRPAFQALLLPEGTRRERAEPASEQELAQAVTELADALPPGLDETAGAARDAARTLRGSLMAMDEEMSALAREVDGEELQALEQKLAALGPAAAGEAASRRERRELLQRQAALLQGSQRRLDELRRQRVARADALHGLWSRLAGLSQELARGAPPERAAADLRAWCAESTTSGPTATVERAAVADLPTLEGPRAS